MKRRNFLKAFTFGLVGVAAVILSPIRPLEPEKEPPIEPDHLQKLANKLWQKNRPFCGRGVVTAVVNGDAVQGGYLTTEDVQWMEL